MILTLAELESLAVDLHAKFPKKKDKQAVAKVALYAEPFGPEHEWVALALLGSHPDRAEKIGCGVADVKPRSATYGTRCFYVTRTDGTSTDYSYLKCLTPPTPRQNVMAACRAAVRDDIEAFGRRRLHEHPFCDLTGMPVTASNSHVHHAPPMFDRLVDAWTLGMHAEVDDRIECGDGVEGLRLNPQDTSTWRAFHRAEARLLLVHTIANFSIEAARRRIKAEQ